MVLGNGTFKLVNARAGTVLDLSRRDHRQVVGYGSHGGDNQKVRGCPYTLHERCSRDTELTCATDVSGS